MNSEIRITGSQNHDQKYSNPIRLDHSSENRYLSFTTFNRVFEERFKITPRFPQTLITLELYSEKDGFCDAGLLLSDQNPFPGIEVVEYGENRNIIFSRKRLENRSVIDLIDDCVRLIEEKYSYELIDGLFRTERKLIPVSSFRSVILNAVLCRDWYRSEPIRVDCFPSRIEVSSPGGLPRQIKAEYYLTDRSVAVLRNKVLVLAFLSLRLVENPGSGISGIMEDYSASYRKPEWTFTGSSISVTLPKPEGLPDLLPEQKQVFDLVRWHGPVSPGFVQKRTEFSRSKVQRMLKGLLDQGLVSRTGKGPSVQYFETAAVF